MRHGVAVESGEHEVGCGGSGQGAPGDRLGAERPEAVLGVVHDRHPEPIGVAVQIEAPSSGRRQRHAPVALARALGLELPAGPRLEQRRVDIEVSRESWMGSSCFVAPGDRRGRAGPSGTRCCCR